MLAASLLAASGLQGERTPADLASFPRLGHAQFEYIKSWHAIDHDGKAHVLPTQDPRFVADNASALLHLARQGGGWSLQPEWLIRRDLELGTLVDACRDITFWRTRYIRFMRREACAA